MERRTDNSKSWNGMEFALKKAFINTFQEYSANPVAVTRAHILTRAKPSTILVLLSDCSPQSTTT